MRQLDPPAAMSVPDFAKWAGIGRTTAFNEIRSGRLKAVKVSSRTLIKYEDAKHWLEALPVRVVDRKRKASRLREA